VGGERLERGNRGMGEVEKGVTREGEVATWRPRILRTFFDQKKLLAMLNVFLFDVAHLNIKKLSIIALKMKTSCLIFST
jgi:hypothetical protein